MGRKSLSEARREEILAAFERCIIREGLDVPLERIADEAGVQRSLIRHYLGNRDELVEQVIGRIAEAYPRRATALVARALEGGVEGMLDALCPCGTSDHDSDAEDFNGWDAVIGAVAGTAQGRHPAAKERVARMMEEIVDMAAASLHRHYPHADQTACREAAYGIFCLSQGHETLLKLSAHGRHTALAREAARRLLDHLAQDGTARASRGEDSY